MNTVDFLRRCFAVGPFRAVRDGLLRCCYRLDPSLSGLREEVAWMREQAVEELPTWSWHRLDRVFAGIRRSLMSQTLQGRPNWRKGPAYGLMVAGHAGLRLQRIAGLRDKSYLDLGCGAHNPYGTAALMWLNGARETVSLDRAVLDERRCAEALFDLLSWCAMFPEDAHWSDIPRQEFLERLSRFDAEALVDGHLAAGLLGLPMRYIAADIHGALPVEAGSVDLMSSRDVLEHFLDFPTALARVAAMMRPGGFAVHHIDLADHRMYRDLDPEDFTVEVRRAAGRQPSGYHAWSFLTEPDFHDTLCNKLRAPDFRNLFAESGFDLVREEPERETLPEGVRERLYGPFRDLSQADLETVRTTLLVRRR